MAKWKEAIQYYLTLVVLIAVLVTCASSLMAAADQTDLNRRYRKVIERYEQQVKELGALVNKIKEVQHD